ncbi:phage portal protein [uncultured Microbacterium sp.]|uniref:phage portal protein n=1 Tax=uncultured Microbacterium sp. TaxID=191216 RepID=UPI0028DB6AFB|nr:phage portal protein [uncultured Microbacterium sp.]
MAFTSPVEALPVLTKSLDTQAAENARLRAYADGTQPGPEMSKKTRASWARFQRFARVLFARLIAESLASRITPTSVKVNGAEEDDDASVKIATGRLRRIWRRSRLDIVLADAILDMLIVGRSFLITADTGGQAIITFEDADHVFAITDPLDPNRVTAAVKVWRDEVAGRDYARVWTGTARQDFSRSSNRTNSKAYRTTNSGGWEVMGDEVPADGVPVTMLLNRGGVSEFAYVTDLLDRISLGILNRLVVVAYQAFKLRYIKGLGLDPDDPEDVKKAEALLDVSPGALLDLGDDAELHEMATTDFRPLLEAVTDDIRELAGTTSTPMSALIPDSANQSAEGARAALDAQILKARDRRFRVGPSIEGSLLQCARIEMGADFGFDIEVVFADPSLATPSETTAAALNAKAVGVPFQTIAVKYLGFTPEDADAMQTQREDEAFMASLTELTPTPPAAAAA